MTPLRHLLLPLFSLTLITAPLLAQDSESTSIGGYGEVHYTNAAGPDTPGQVNVRRLVLYLAHTFNEHLAFRSELELEDAKIEGGEAGGEVALEQFYLDYLIA